MMSTVLPIDWNSSIRSGEVRVACMCVIAEQSISTKHAICLAKEPVYYCNRIARVAQDKMSK
jgi:hypothetical protein